MEFTSIRLARKFLLLLKLYAQKRRLESSRKTKSLETEIDDFLFRDIVDIIDVLKELSEQKSSSVLAFFRSRLNKTRGSAEHEFFLFAQANDHYYNYTYLYLFKRRIERLFQVDSYVPNGFNESVSSC